jgi:hypothetical protein
MQKAPGEIRFCDRDEPVPWADPDLERRPRDGRIRSFDGTGAAAVIFRATDLWHPAWNTSGRFYRFVRGTA